MNGCCSAHLGETCEPWGEWFIASVYPTGDLALEFICWTGMFIGPQRFPPDLKIDENRFTPNEYRPSLSPPLTDRLGR